MGNILVIARGVIRELVRRKDFYLILALLAIIVAYASSLSLGGESGFHRYFKEIGLSFTYLFSVIIAAVFASRQIPQEVESKTIYALLAHPVSRWQFISGKFFGVFFASLISFSAYYIFFLGSLYLRGDFSTPLLLLLEGYLLQACLLSFFTSLAMLLSLFLSVAANAIIIIILYLATNWFGAVFPAYIFFPHPELFDIKNMMIHTFNIIPAWVIAFLILYAFIYTSIFLTGAYLVFRRRNL